MPKLVCVIIPTWNGRAFLAYCLPAVAAQLGAEAELVVVDNGSQDGTADWLAQHFPRVRLLRNPTNLGFAVAVNQGIRATASEFVVLLNDDTVVDDGWLAALIQAAGSDPDVGMCACHILRADAPHLFDSAGIEVDWAGVAWNRWAGDPAETHPGLEPEAVFGACGAAALYRRAMLDQIGLFDEDFFAYYEDVDLAWRARRAGWRCLYVPRARLLHAHSGTGRRVPELKRYLIGRNKLWTLVKNYPLAWLCWRWPLILLIDAAMAVGMALKERNGASLRGRWDALRALPRFWRKRTPGAGESAPLVAARPPWKM
ncbi:MAG: glycosyltransferase family 2 protein [Chloroflexota bacterium]